MIDVFRVADVFVTHAVKTHGSDVAIIAYYGSYATGTASGASDLDLIYIPDEGKAPSLPACFVLDGISFDFFPLSWERADRLATGRDGWAVGPSLIANARVLYARSEADRARLDALRAQVDRLRSPESREHMVRRAGEAFKSAAFHLGSLQLAVVLGDFASVRRAGWGTVMAAVECLALVNQTTCTRGWDANLAEMLELSARPADLEAQVTTVATSSHAEQVLLAATALAGDTRAILSEAQGALPSRSSVADTFADYYPEIHDKVNKIIARCNAGHPVGASWAATFVQDEISLFMEQALSGVTYSGLNLYREYAGHYRRAGLPDLMQVPLVGDRATLAEQAEHFDQRIRAWLQGEGIGLNTLASLDDLAQFLAARGLAPEGVTEPAAVADSPS